MNRRKSQALGARIRKLRQRRDMAQVELARQLEISASYLNLIEHGHRPMPAHLLIKLAQIFELDLSEFGAEDDEQLAGNLHEVASDPLFEGHGIADQELLEFAQQSPGMARAMVALYEAYQEAQESVRTLSSRLSTDQDMPGVAPWRLPSEEVSDLLQQNMNYFSPLEEAAERLWQQADLKAYDLQGGLVRYLREAHGIKVSIVKADASERKVRRFDGERKLLLLSELLEPHSVVFQLAHQICLITQSEALDELTDDKRLTSEDSRALGRVALANYFAGAVMMPYQSFLEASEELRYDVDMLGARFRSSFEQVCHRLTTLRRPGAEGVPFHFLRVDIAGNISKRFSASGIQFARFSGACPRWNLVNCFLTPGQIRVQLSASTDNRRYLCIARTVHRGVGGFATPPPVHAICLGTRLEHAHKLVYSDGVDLDNEEAPVPVGVTCRLCERMDCEQRALPPLQRTLSIDENVRGLSFYGSLKE